MIKEIQVNKTKDLVYAMDGDGQVTAIFPMSRDFWPGQNDAGEPYCNAANGVYDVTDQEIDADGPCTDNNYTSDRMAFGWGYINIDERGHALHGGGTNLGDPACDDPDQELIKTNGCFRMHNKDIYWLALAALETRKAGETVLVTVVED